MKNYEEYFNTLEDLYLSSYKLVYLFISDYTKNRQIIEDISSVIWIKITRNPQKYLDMDKQRLFNYLKLMAKTAYIDYYNASKRENQKLVEFYESDFIEIISSNNDETLREEDHKYLTKALYVLKDDEKLLIKLKYNQEMSYKEISQILGMSEGSLRTKQSRIYNKLKAEIMRLRMESES